MTTLTDTGQGDDIAIGGLPFKLAISPERPYERATAQFRKEQLDSAPTVGDQSLTGWWTRGQLSFHRGSGLKYYEVLDGETVENRFQDSNKIDPFAVPGEVVLRDTFSSIYAANVVDAVPAPTAPGGSGAALILNSTGALKVVPASGAASTAIATSDAGAANAITSDGTYFYACNGQYIESQSANPAIEIRNFVSNPGFEIDATGWSTTAATGTPPTLVTGGFRKAYGTAVRNRCFLDFSTTTTDWTVVHTVTGLTAGANYVFSVYVEMTNQEYEDGHIPYTIVDGIDGQEMPSDHSQDAVRLTQTFTATGTTAVVGIAASGSTILGQGGFMLAAASVAEAPSFHEYADGDSPGWVWDGTSGQSQSRRAASASTTLTRLWATTIPGAEWLDCFWAKGRMFAVDDAGRWFAMSPSGAEVGDIDAFWKSGFIDSTSRWSLAETPGALFIARDETIYGISITDDGAVPVISAPAIEAQLPRGEHVEHIQYYLGHLILCTSAGVRLARVVGADLTLGPLIAEGSASTARVGVSGNFAYAPLVIDGVSSLLVLSFADTISDLKQPWARAAILTGTGASPCGAMVADDGVLCTFDETGLYREDGLATSGYVTTGFHRLGTLEPKSFQYLRVKTEGTVGTVTVDAITPDGATVNVGVVNAGDSSNLPLRTALPSPVEYVGLKFTLAGDGTNGPTLLGYQLKALPAPERQRMIRVPLLLEDVERRGGTRAIGYAGSAWARLDALEDMEATGGVHDYQDFRTGETGTVFIEAIEHRGTTPPSGLDGNFGGIVWVTMRKL